MSGEEQPVSADDAREIARDILSGSDFEQEGMSPLERFGSWIADRLNDLFGSSDGPAVGSGGGGGVRGPEVSYVVAIVLLIVLVVLIWRATKSGWFTKMPKPDGPEVVEKEFQHPDDWLSAAAEAVAAGNWAEALRCRYRGLVASLARRGSIREIPGRTTGEHRADVETAEPDRAQPFTKAADMFDGVWYGGVLVGPDEFRRFEHTADEVLAP